MKTLLLIDGNAIMHRAYHAIPKNFTTSTGVPTNAVYGFATMLYKVITDFQPAYIVICFDTPKPTFRKQMYEAYQAHRAKVADEFIVQIPLIKEMLEKANITQIEKEGYEADDLIGTMVSQNKEKVRIIILTGDKDIMQLVDDNVFVISPQTGVSSITMFDRQGVINKTGIVPEKIPDLKALMGDASDNYGGAKGIGPKTASDLLSKFGTVEKVLEKSNNIENERIRNIVKEHREHIELSKKLATIRQDVPISINLESSKFEGFSEDFKKFLLSLQMSSLVTRIFERKETKKSEKKEDKKEPIQDDLFS